ncbi:uncharacterized protein [Henckelia pumila]|uniref:uncharacterized protein n=1 Tax=Henckelia pumila TaxID=405737 RepID=UPI003C6E27B1
MEILEFVLDGRARLWWDAKAAHARTEKGCVTWEDFCQQFQKLYFPQAVRQTRSMEFLMLRQGAMTIDEYQQRFINLLPYSPYINESDASKYDLFLQGLNQDIYSQVVVCDDPTSYETLVNRFRQVDKNNRRAQLMMSGHPGGFLGPRAQYFVHSGSTSASNTTFSSTRGSRGMFRFGKNKKYDRCTHYVGKHSTTTCRRASGACYICGQQGHLRRDCPSRMGAASGSV